MKPIRFFIRVLAALCLLSAAAYPSACRAEALPDGKTVLFFYSETCADCHAAKALMDAVLKAVPDARIVEIDADAEPDLWKAACEDAGIPVWGVPRIFIGDLIFAGWSERAGDLIYIPAYYGYMGYRNQVVLALEEYLGIAVPESVVIPEQAAPAGGGCVGGC